MMVTPSFQDIHSALKTGKCQEKIMEKSGILKLRLSGNAAVGYGQKHLDIAPSFYKIVPDIRF